VMSSLLARDERGLPGAGSLRYCLSGPVSPLPTPTTHPHDPLFGTWHAYLRDER
jgi:hypothetical protein